jgi:hypothetical protein
MEMLSTRQANSIRTLFMIQPCQVWLLEPERFEPAISPIPPWPHAEEPLQAAAGRHHEAEERAKAVVKVKIAAVEAAVQLTSKLWAWSLENERLIL